MKLMAAKTFGFQIFPRADYSINYLTRSIKNRFSVGDLKPGQDLGQKMTISLKKSKIANQKGTEKFHPKNSETLSIR